MRAFTGFTLSSTARILDGENVFDAFNGALNDAALSFSISSVSGGVNGYKNAQASGKNGWTGKKVVAKTSQYDFNPDPNGNNVRLYRGTTGSEGKGTLFLTDDPSYAASYVKNGGNIVELTISRNTFNQMQYNNVIQSLKGSHVGMYGNEYVIYDKSVVNQMILNFKPYK